MVDYSPPFFPNIGKAFKDLFTKKYDFDNMFKVTNKTDVGATFTTTAKLGGGSIQGQEKIVVVEKNRGELELELDTSNEKAYGKLTFDSLVKNTKFMIGGGFDPNSKEPIAKAHSSVKGEVEHREDAWNTSGSVLVGEDFNAAVVTANVAFGWDGFSLGGMIKSDLKQLSDANFGFQYERKNFVAAAFSEQLGQVTRASWVHKVCPTKTLGFEVIFDDNEKLAKGRKLVLSFGSEYQLDPDTSVKGRWNNFGELATVVEHRLHNPHALVGAAASFKVKGLGQLQLDKFGLSLSVGCI